MYNKKTRPSPTDSATWYEPGTYKKGNDGNMYTITINSAGVHRWVMVPKGFVPVEIYSSKHPNHPSNNKLTTTPNNKHKFKIGDLVKVVRSGSGCGFDDVGVEVVITELGNYGSTSNLHGYKVSLEIGNTKTGEFGGFIGESSFELVYSSLPVNKPIKLNNMAKTKKLTKKTTAEQRTINTSLINKEEVFKMLALAEATGLPLLLVGDPGVAKTKTIIEYAKAWLNRDGQMSSEDFMNKIYILETDEGTKSSEIKGMPDLETLFTDNKFQLSTPIADAEIVIINEVDKASSGIRNAMLGVMNEKFLFNGKHKIPCKWKLFVATCNEIPKEEVNSPFWDRFMLKMTVGRVSAGEMAKYYQKGARSYKESFTIGIPSKQEIENVSISSNKLEKYLEVGYTQSSDRTLTFVPMLSKAVSYIWDVSMDKALVKTAQIMINQSAGSTLQSKLLSTELKAVMSKVEMLNSHSTKDSLELAIAEIESLINVYTTRGSLDEGQVEDIELSMSYVIENHPVKLDKYSSIEEFEALVEENEVDNAPCV